MGGDGATSDIGFGALSGALQRGHDFHYICLDNEAYMNTGIQQSSATPFGASTTTAPAGEKSFGQVSWKKNLPAIVAAHDVPYVATACPSYFHDLIAKVRKAMAVRGPAYIQVLSVCPTGWRCPTNQTIRMGRLAVETGMFPLYEVINGEYKLNLDLPKLRPVRDYLKAQGRFRHLSDKEINHIQARVDEEYAGLKKLSRISEAPERVRPAVTCVPESKGELTTGLPALQETVDGILTRYRNDQALLISILQDIQAAYNYLPKESLERVSLGLKIPLTQVYSVATFFKTFSLTPRGRNLIHVCLGTACHVRGAARLRDKIQRVLNIEPGGTTPDFRFTLETVNCVGACALGPVVMINGKYHGQMTPHKVDALLKSYT
jgi:NADH:ubiquinone oxidoreductase subunit E